MKETPILYSGPMVRAYLSGNKWQTRRTRGLEKINQRPEAWRYDGLNVNGHHLFFDVDGWQTGHDPHECSVIVKSPYGAAGDLLWGRETWCPANSEDGPVLCYRADLHRRYLVHESYPVDYDKYPAGRAAWVDWAADLESGTEGSWRPSIFMPRWASRISQKIIEVRPERLKNISATDALGEGIATTEFWRPKEMEGRPFEEQWWDDSFFWEQYPQIAYLKAWDSLNAQRGYPSESNPWVWVITYPPGRFQGVQ